MGRKPRVDRTPEEKWQIVQEGIKSGNVSETCRRHGIAPNLFYRWKDEAEQGAKAALGGRSAAASPPKRSRSESSTLLKSKTIELWSRVLKDKRRGKDDCLILHAPLCRMAYINIPASGTLLSPWT
jgi:transposase-like protein